MSPITLPTTFSARPATLEDAQAVTDLMNRCAIAQLGHPTTDISETQIDWASPYCPPATNIRLVFDGDRLVGYAGIWTEPPFAVLNGWARVDPDYKQRGIGAYLATWMAATARAHSLPQAPEGARVVLQQTKGGNDTDSQALLDAQGYRPVRHWLRMRIELDAPPPPPALPTSLTIRTFNRQRDLPAFVRAEQAILQDHWGHVPREFDQDLKDWGHYIDQDPHHDPTLWFMVVTGEEEIVGICLSTVHRPGEPQMGYIGLLGVQRAWRHQGIGLAMLHHAFGEIYRRGKTQVTLDVDAESLTGATRLYEKAGMHVQRQSISYELVLREGKNLTTETLDTSCP